MVPVQREREPRSHRLRVGEGDRGDDPDGRPLRQVESLSLSLPLFLSLSKKSKSKIVSFTFKLNLIFRD